MDVSVENLDEEYELIEDTEDSGSTASVESRKIDGGNGGGGGGGDASEPSTETEVNVDHSAIFTDQMEGEVSQPEESIVGRSSNGAADTSLLFNSEVPIEETKAEKLMETEVDIDYKNLFHGNRA